MKLIKKIFKYLMWSIWIISVPMGGYQIYTQTGSWLIGFYLTVLLYGCVATFILIQKQLDAHLDLIGITIDRVVETVAHINNEKNK